MENIQNDQNDESQSNINFMMDTNAFNEFDFPNYKIDFQALKEIINLPSKKER